MPRIEKVRISGVRYDKMKKHYENTVFDFFHETEPQHALLTLVNGGGKGMLLQMIFQVLLPLTTWGKNGENHIDALFYNEKQQFEPYTFHVALEWRLDTDPAEWLVTGICVTARKNGAENEEINTEPHYFLYTSKYRKPDEWQIETLPFYDEEKKLITSYDNWEDWLKKHKQQFLIYSKSKQPAYYQYLASYGIEKGEWRQMREINRDEGGIEHYFKKGLDNFGLFHHLIIPEISAYLEEDQEENLVKIFRDNSIIAQKLPKLMKREEAYQLIQEKIVPLKTALEEGQNLETAVWDHKDRANYLYFGMEEQKQTYQFDQEKWEEDKRISEHQQADFLWQKDNLEFAKECRSFEEISGQIGTVGTHIEQLTELIKGLKSEKHDLRVSIGKKDYMESTNELERIDSRISFLEKTQNLQVEKDETAKIEAQLAEDWKDIKVEIQADLEKFNSLEKRLQKEMNGLSSQTRLHQKDLNDVRSKLGTYTDYIKKHNQKAITMGQKYGRDVNRDPEFVLRKITKELQDLESVLVEQQNERDDQQSNKVKFGELIGEMNERIKFKKNELAHVSKKIMGRLAEEQLFHQNFSRYFFIDEAFQPFTQDDWDDISGQLASEQERLKFQYETIRKDFWHHQLDTALVNDDYWVANDDVRKMAEKLAEEGISATYGTQLIQELPAEEQALLLEKYPLLAYGVVVHQHDWDRKAVKDELQQMLARSPVPIFIRERMNQEYSLPFEIIRDQGLSMAFDRERWIVWKEKLADLTDRFIADLEKAESRIEAAGLLMESVKTLSPVSYQEMLQEESTLAGEQASLEEQLKKLQAELASVESRLVDLKKNIQHAEQERRTKEIILQEIKSWVDQYQQFQEYQDLKAEAQRKEAVLAEWINKLEKQKEEQGQSLSNWEKAFQMWKVRMEQETRQLKEVLPSILFPVADSLHMQEEDAPVLRNVIFDKVYPSVRRWQHLQQKINSADSELAAEKAKREYQLRDQQLKKAELDELEPNWTDREIPNLPKEILLQQLKTKEEEINKTIREMDTEKGKLNGLHGQLVQIEKTLQKQKLQILKNHQRSSEPWADVNLEETEQMIDAALKKIQHELTEQKAIIADLAKRQQQLQKQQDILKSHLPGFKQVGEIPSSYKDQIKADPAPFTQQWIRQNNELSIQQETYQRVFKEKLKDLGLVLQDEKIDTALRQNLNQLLPQLESDSFRSGLSIMNSVIEFIQHELLKLKDDKQKAEQAQEIWVDRAVIRVIRIFQSLKQMVNRMKIKNREGHSFPLVEIERLKEIETADDGEYRRLLREHFTQTIEKLLEHDEPLENLSDNELKKYIDDSQLVLVSLRSRYPRLLIYKPQTTNAFMYEKPRKHHYTEWETLNKGSKMEAKGSGGQLLAARTMIMMMIMTFKRQEHSENWSVLITDNPFGQAVSAHILDPIFSIAEILRFQWIVLAPPELIKLDVSRRFPVYWKLELSQQKHGEMVREILQHGGRTFEEAELSLF